MQKGKERVFKARGFHLYHQNFPKKQLGKHRHKEAHLFIPLTGTLIITVGDIDYKIKAGEMMFVGASVDHSFEALGEDGERLILQVDNFKFKKEVSILPLNHLIKDLAMNLFGHENESYTSKMTNLIYEVLKSSLDKDKDSNQLFRTQQLILSIQNQQLRKIVKVLEQNPENSLTEIADVCGLSTRTLSRLTKEETGLSPNELHTFYRIKKASELIYQGELGLTAIAFECGYNSLSQFIQNFKLWTGSKPSDFKPFQ